MTPSLWVDNEYFNVENYSITLDSTPLLSTDTSGSVGEFTVNLQKPVDPDHLLNLRGTETLEGKDVELHSDYGIVNGTVDRVVESNGHAITLECTSYAGGLNAYNVQAKPIAPFVGYSFPTWGRLNAALTYYFSLGKHDVSLEIDPEIAQRKVIYAGWSGELWYHLKMLCIAEEIQLVLEDNNVVRAEPIRRTSIDARQFSSISTTTDSSNLAQHVEVREYNSESAMTPFGLPFYPPGGWSEDTEILQVNAGEYTEQTIRVAGSIDEIISPPTMKTFIAKDDTLPGYTVIAEDGFPIQPQQWEDAGGHISFEVGEDSRTVIVKMKGAKGIRLDTGEEASSFALALSSDTGGSSRYSTLRIRATGVLHDHEKTLKVATGVPPAETGTDVGVTIDNPFLFNRDRVGRAASQAARQFAGAVLTVQGEAFQLSGGFNVDDTGARIEVNGRPYRVRGTTYSPEGVSVNLEDDLTYGDVEDALDGQTYGDVEDDNEGLTYRNVISRGTR